MTIEKDALYEEEYNCLVTDLVGGYPPNNIGVAGSKMYVWDGPTKELSAVFKKVLGSWYKI